MTEPKAPYPTDPSIPVATPRRTSPLATPFETRTFIVSFMMLASFAIIVLFWWKPPDPQNQLLNTLIGIFVGTGFTTSINWWMGSSKGSSDKNGMLTTALNGKEPTQ